MRERGCTRCLVSLNIPAGGIIVKPYQQEIGVGEYLAEKPAWAVVWSTKVNQPFSPGRPTPMGYGIWRGTLIGIGKQQGQSAAG
jgi:hypothetical protein